MDAVATIFEQRFKQLIEREQAIHDAKRNDYTGGQDPLANYRFSSSLVGLTVEQAMLQRIGEKVYRLSVLLGGQKQQVNDESILDTCLDIAIIAKLIAIAWETRSAQG